MSKFRERLGRLAPGSALNAAVVFEQAQKDKMSGTMQFILEAYGHQFPIERRVRMEEAIRQVLEEQLDARVKQANREWYQSSLTAEELKRTAF